MAAPNETTPDELVLDTINQLFLTRFPLPKSWLHARSVNDEWIVTVEITTTCCSSAEVLFIPASDLFNWLHNSNAAYSMPHLAADGRELLITGYCGC